MAATYKKGIESKTYDFKVNVYNSDRLVACWTELIDWH